MNRVALYDFNGHINELVAILNETALQEMKKLITLFALLTLYISCQSQAKEMASENFEKELTAESINEFKKNTPLINFPYLSGKYTYYPYFKVFGNSGASIIYELNSEREKILNSKIKSFKRFYNNSLEEKDSNDIYYSKDINIAFPAIHKEYDQVLPVPTPKDSEVEIYLIKKGNLKRAFDFDIDKENHQCQYSIGIYLIRSQKRVIYWFLIYEDKNRH